MPGVNGIGRRQRGELRVRKHGGRTLAGFLGGLEQEVHAAALGRCAREVVRECDERRHVTVVSALVRDARGAGPPGQVVRLVDGQRVELGAQQDDRTRCPTLEDGDDARAAHPFEQPRRMAVTECGGNPGCRVALRVGELGACVQPPAKGHRIGVGLC